MWDVNNSTSYPLAHPSAINSSSLQANLMKNCNKTPFLICLKINYFYSQVQFGAVSIDNVPSGIHTTHRSSVVPKPAKQEYV